MRDETERAEISKAKNLASSILKRADERRQKILEQADVAAKEEVEVFEKELKSELARNVYDLSPFQKELQESKRSDIDHAKADYERHEQEVVDFLISHLTDVRIELQRNIKANFEELKVNP